MAITQRRAVEPRKPRQPAVLAGQVAVVTGACGLLGRHHCEALAEAGAAVVAVDLDGDRCQAIAASLSETHGVDALGVGVDIADEQRVMELRDAVIGRFDRVDVLVNNAAIDDKVVAGAEQANPSMFEHFPVEAFRRSLDVNVTGTFLCCQKLGAEMARRGHGSIINIASTYGVVAPDQRLYRAPDGSQTFFKSAAYPASKGAVLALTRFLASYWGPQGVRVNALSPGGVRSDQPAHFVEAYASRTPLGRMAEAGDYRGAVVFLASDASRYMTGANLVVDGGWTSW